MKRVLCLFVMLLIGSWFADVSWLEKWKLEVIERNFKKDVVVTASAVCNTQEEVEKLCRIDNLEDRWGNVWIGEPDDTDWYMFFFIQRQVGRPRIVVYHFRKDGLTDEYQIY